MRSGFIVTVAAAFVVLIGPLTNTFGLSAFSSSASLSAMAEDCALRDTMEWGHEAPQGPHTEIPEVASTIPKTVIGEDCQVLNVWTNSLTGKRPVMVWLHGGGFTSGNGCYTMYDGANLARKRDVVAVTLNHRLNAFGYMYLGGIGGEKYATSGNLGMTVRSWGGLKYPQRDQDVRVQHELRFLGRRRLVRAAAGHR